MREKTKRTFTVKKNYSKIVFSKKKYLGRNMKLYEKKLYVFCCKIYREWMQPNISGNLLR